MNKPLSNFLSRHFKKATLPLIFLILLTLVASTLFAQRQSHKLCVRPEFQIEWNLPNGLPFVKDPAGNFGVTTFSMMEGGQIAFLENKDNKIKIFNVKTGGYLREFSVEALALDLATSNNNLYILHETHVAVYGSDGTLLRKIPFDFIDLAQFVRVVDGGVYILTADERSVLVEQSGQPTIKVFKGLVLNDGLFAATYKMDDFNYALEMYDREADVLARTSYRAPLKLISVILAGYDQGVFFLDVQYITNDLPLQVKREFQVVAKNRSGFTSVGDPIEVPNVYGLYMPRYYDIRQETLYHAVTAPDRLYMFTLELCPGTTSRNTGYPSALMNSPFHFNDDSY